MKNNNKKNLKEENNNVILTTLARKLGFKNNDYFKAFLKKYYKKNFKSGKKYQYSFSKEEVSVLENLLKENFEECKVFLTKKRISDEPCYFNEAKNNTKVKFINILLIIFIIILFGISVIWFI